MTTVKSNTPWILITGSSSGIGWAIAQSLSQKGYPIILHGLEPVENLKTLAQQLNQESKQPVEVVSADLSDSGEIAKMSESILTRAITPQVIINNAGFQHVAAIENFPLQTWKKMLDVHVTAPFQITQYFLPHMKKLGWGRIINIASVHGLVASAQKSAYVSAKHALLGFTKTLALETAGTGVTANAICPGWVQTPLVEKQIADRAQIEGISLHQAREKLLGEKQPSREFIKTSDLASLVFLLCSDVGGSMNGSILTIDGGWTAQ